MESVSVIKILDGFFHADCPMRARFIKLVNLSLEIFLRAGIFGLMYALLSQQVNATSEIKDKKISSNKNYLSFEYSKKLTGRLITKVVLNNDINESDAQQKNSIWDHPPYQHTDPPWLSSNERQGAYYFEFALMGIELVFSPLTNRGPPHLSVQYLLPPPEPVLLISQSILLLNKSRMFTSQYIHLQLFSTGLIFSQRGSYVIS
jgi:hypothetical protein